MTGLPATLIAKILNTGRLWVLTAGFIASLLIWFAAFFLRRFPDDVQTYTLGAAIVFGTLAGCKSVSDLREKRRAVAARKSRKLLRLYRRLYRPLYVLFLKNHPAVLAGQAPDLRERLEKAWRGLGTSRSRRRGIQRAWHALVDGPTLRAVYDHGAFPFKAIEKLALENQHHADVELLELVNRVYESYIEEGRSDELTGAEFALYNHIMGKHRKLSRRFG